jgi:threonine/homoserine/homoserine lactone efflux protein
MILIILKSLALGFFMTLPVGPVGVLCLRKILQLGPFHGFILGLSQVLAMFIFSIIAIFTFGYIADYIFKYEFWLLLIGGLALIAFGIKMLFSRSSAITKKGASKKGFIADFFSIIFFILISPNTWVAFFIIFAILGLYGATTLIDHIVMVLGILTGSFFSWVLICLCFSGYKTNATWKVMTWINRSVGALLTVFGVALCISAFFLT